MKKKISFSPLFQDVPYRTVAFLGRKKHTSQRNGSTAKRTLIMNTYTVICFNSEFWNNKIKKSPRKVNITALHQC
jgi:hypothetical protein